MGRKWGQPRTSTAYLTQGLDAVVQTFSPTLDPTTEQVEIKNAEAVASYSWTSEKTPTIIVPVLGNVSADTGLIYLDQNSARLGHDVSPLSPIFAAIADMNKEECLKDVDIISDRNNLRKLLKWVTGSADDGFRMDVDVVGNTCLLTRVDDFDSETIVGFRGFGRQYEKVSTKLPPGNEKSTGHYRVISFDFGGIKILLRCEVDACTGVVGDDLHLLNTTRPKANVPPTPDNPFSELTILHTQPTFMVPQSSLIELKTRSAKRPLEWDEVYAQLYFSQMPYLYVARHNNGKFSDVRNLSITGSHLQACAKRAESGMAQLKAALLSILRAVRAQGAEARLSLVYRDGQLVLYKRKEGAGRPVGADIKEMIRQATST
ncbi:hypothetical protein FRB99_008587 [Tulasnella sp. 403]|nr:hypothetical protein FRB99_008587 [Tulasnella sp. 403]